MKALFIDDEKLIRKGLQSFIDWKKYGFDYILEADSGKDGIVLIKRENPELILLDIRMPDMDGIEVCEKIRTSGYKGQIIIISGYSDFSYAKSALTWNVTDYLLKPVGIDELESAVQKALQEYRRENLLSYYETIASETPKTTVFKSLLTGDSLYTPELEQQWSLHFAHYFHLTSISFPENGHKSMSFTDTLFHGLEHFLYVVINNILFILSLSPQSLTILSDNIAKSRQSLSDGNIFIVYGRNFSDPLRLNTEYEQLMYIHQNLFFYNNAEGCYSLAGKPANAFSPFNFNLLDNTGNLVTAVLTSDKNSVDDLLSQLYGELTQRKSSIDVTAMILCNYYQQLLDILLLTYPRLEIAVPDHHTLLNRLANLHYLYEYMDYLKLILYKIIDIIQESNLEHPFLRIQTYIDANLTSTLRLEEVASLFKYNSTYLGKLFKKETGVSFNSYLNIKRIEYAKTLLQKNVSVTEAAEKSGYSSFNYFTMIFKQLTGDTPSKYRSRFCS